MWAEIDIHRGVPCLQSYTSPVNGTIYRMYHGTTEEAAELIRNNGFKPSEDGMLGHGVYLSRDLSKASRYPLGKDGVVIRVDVNVGKVKKIDYKNHPLQKTWNSHGYDTAWCPPNCGMVPSGLEEDCVWDPKRIKFIDIIPPSIEHIIIPTELLDDKVYTMFFGTSKENVERIKVNGFCRTKGPFGRGVYLSRCPEIAFKVPTHVPAPHRRVLRVKVNVGRVKRFDSQEDQQQRTWFNNGYDTAWCPPGCPIVSNGLEKNCIRDPKRITVIDVICSK